MQHILLPLNSFHSTHKTTSFLRVSMASLKVFVISRGELLTVLNMVYTSVDMIFFLCLEAQYHHFCNSDIPACLLYLLSPDFFLIYMDKIIYFLSLQDIPFLMILYNIESYTKKIVIQLSWFAKINPNIQKAVVFCLYFFFLAK